METLINFFCYKEKGFILMNTWIARKDLMKNHHQIKKIFLQQIKLEDITDKDYAHPQQVFAELKLKTLGDYHDLHVQHDTLLLADAFENFGNKCIEVYELGPDHFLFASGLAQQACFKKIGVKLELLTYIDCMLLIFEKRIRDGICHSIRKYAKSNNKYMINQDKDKESSYLEYLDPNSLYGWAMSKKLPVNGFELVEDLS